jgi:hypothetical protein
MTNEPIHRSSPSPETVPREDGPYDETPVEQEGQADLERFFDDHLGASDREGMDKENLPSNLVALLSAAPQVANLKAFETGRLPLDRLAADQQQQQPPASTLTVVPSLPVVNPIVHS